MIYNTFRCSGITFVFVASMLMILEGCDPNQKGGVVVVRTKPKIVVKQSESQSPSQSKNSMTICFENHKFASRSRESDDLSNFYVDINTREELTEYKSQIEFLLVRLKDVEERMLINEDKNGQKTTGP